MNRSEPELLNHLKKQGVEYCYVTFVDVHGISKTKCVPINHFASMIRGSELFTVGALDGMGLIGPHYDECSAIPDLASATILPWDHRYCWFAADLHFQGTPYANCSRVILRRALDRAASAGFRFNLGIEPEFYVYRRSPDGLVPIQPRRFGGNTPAYDLHQISQAKPLLEQIAGYVDQLGWGLYSFDQEGGHGQFEIDFGYADALTTADRLTFFRFMVKIVAEQHGVVATFMPKPYSDDFRSGAHYNMSLAELDGVRNVFDAEACGSGPLAASYELAATDICLNFAGGLLQHAEALCAITCPTYNSYKGLVARGDMPDMSWAPVLRAYGRNNRSAMLRLPMNRPCIENRTPDMSTNFYLAAAISLHAGLDGIDQAADPGAPLNDNLYLDPGVRNSVRRLPRTLLEAIDALDTSDFARTMLGDDFVTLFVTQKRREWDASFYAVTPAEREKFLEFV
jgi:glutamine synthetase